MTITALALALTLTVSSTAPETGSASAVPAPQPRVTIAAAATAPASPAMAAATPASERWRFDAAEKRPAALPALYATFGVLQLADAYSTRRAVSTGAYEANPLMQDAAKRSSTMYAVKAASAAASIYLAEKMWKKNRKGAVITMIVINGVSAAVVAHNMRNASR